MMICEIPKWSFVMRSKVRQSVLRSSQSKAEGPVLGASDLYGAVKGMMRTDEEHDRARQLILRHGWNATAYQILNPGIELWFSRAAEGVIGFVKHGRTRVVGGAPVCDHDLLAAIAGEFADDARESGERVCYFGAGDRLDSTLGAKSGWSRVLLGAQPVWDPKRWSVAVNRRGSLRAQFNRARNKGLVVTEWPSGVAQNHPELRRCLGEWLETRHLPPLHFMVEPETLSELRDRRVFVAERGGHQVVGFTVLSPVPARDGWLVEQIVRGRRAPNGTAELLLDSAMRTVATDGSSYVTLGLSPLSQHAPVVLRHPPWLRFVLRWVRLHGARFYNFAGLDSFKAKFNPEVWEPIYAIGQGRAFSPRDLYAIAGAFSGGTPMNLIGAALARAVRQETLAIMRLLKQLVFGR
jgi:phosphatidylglycerol lysyltransferase